MIEGVRRRVAGFARGCHWHGVGPMLHRGWQRHFARGRRTLLLFGLSLPNDLSAADQGVASRLAAREDVPRLVAAGRLDEDCIDLFDAGDACLLQFVGDRLAGTAWLASRDEVELFAGLRLKVPSDACYLYRSWTKPEFRGHRLQARRTRSLFEEVRRRGRHRAVCFVESTNLASLKGVARAGYRRVAQLDWTHRPAERMSARLRVESPDWSELAVRTEAEAPRG